MLLQCFAGGQATNESSTSAPNSSSKRSLCFTCRNHENRFHKIHQNPSQVLSLFCKIGNWDLWRSNGPSTRIGEFHLSCCMETILRSLFRNIGQNQTSAQSHRGCAISPAFSPASRPWATSPVGVAQCLEAFAEFWKSVNCGNSRQLAITAMPSTHSHERHDTHDTHVHPHWKPNKFAHLPSKFSFRGTFEAEDISTRLDTLGSRQTRSKQSGRDTALAPHWTDRMDWIRIEVMTGNLRFSSFKGSESTIIIY